MTTIRLNKLIASHGFCSRRKADEWIKNGRISVDGIICRELGTVVDPEQQTIMVDGRPLAQPPKKIYLALNKPTGVVTTCDDPQGRKTVLGLLPKTIVKQGIFPVGRLDSDSKGLIFLTNDGDWNQHLLHPSRQVWKEYLVHADKPLDERQKQKLQHGIKLDGTLIAPARLSGYKKTKSGSQFHLAIREGRNRQIRRMCKVIRIQVLSLQRVSIGPIKLGDLAEGEYRYLEKKEVELFI